MVAGSLARAGYFMGDKLMPASASNPRGFFEDIHVNSLNEDILEQAPAGFRNPILHKPRKRNPVRHQRWLIEMPVTTIITATPSLVARIQTLVNREPYCFKDPRFSYTLPAWQPHLRNAVVVVVFRHPVETARSIVRECADEPRLRGLGMKMGRAVRIWQATYARALHLARGQDDWLFLEYEQVLRGNGLQRLAAATGARIDTDFPAQALHRNVSRVKLHGRNRRLYSALCAKAGIAPAGARE